jgi:hypothetical protein
MASDNQASHGCVPALDYRQRNAHRDDSRYISGAYRPVFFLATGQGEPQERSEGQETQGPYRHRRPPDLA